MSSLLGVLCALATLGSTLAQTGFIGFVELPNPTILNVYNHSDVEPSPFRRYSILVGSDSPAASTYDSTRALHYPGEWLDDVANTPVKIVYDFVYAPKEIQQVPNVVLDHDAIIHFDGNTQVGETRGAIYITDMSDFQFPVTYDISSDVLGQPEVWAYHTGLWKLANNDNRWDLLACRVQIEEGAMKLAQLVWLEQPLNALERNWRLSVLKEAACDGNMVTIRFDIGVLQSYDAVFTTGRYTQRLNFFWSVSADDYWDDPDNVNGGVIETGREYHDIVASDINNDGRTDLLVAVGSNTDGSVEVWEIPDDFRIESGYVKHVLATGFVSTNAGADGRSPATARTFYPDTNHARKPWITVAGGDDGIAYILIPENESPTDWNYRVVEVIDQGTGERVGGMATADVDGDGYQELFVSVPTRSRIEVYTFHPDGAAKYVKKQQ